jgi:hypothetical protein
LSGESRRARIVVAAGGYRSGSTLQYNLLGIYVERLGAGRRVGWVAPDAADAVVGDWLVHGEGLAVVKCHHVATGFRPFRTEDAWARYVRDGTAVAMISCRDEQAVQDSMCRKFGLTPETLPASLEWRENVANVEAWRALGAFAQDYTELVGSPSRALRNLCGWLRLPWRRSTCFETWVRTRPVVVRRHQQGVPQGAWDPVTLIHPDHISERSPVRRLRREQSERR